MLKIAYGAGHGYYTPGKRTPSGEREWTFNNELVKGFEKGIKQYKGVKLLRLDDPTGKKDIGLNVRTSKANVFGADYYFSFHHNAKIGDKYYNDVTGIETFVNTLNNGVAHNLAKILNDVMVNSYGLKNRGVKAANGRLAELRDTKMPSILFEGGFMDSSIDIVKMRDFKLLQKAGENVAHRFAKYEKLQLIDKPKEVIKEGLKLNETMRIEARQLLKNAIKKGIINKAIHTDAKINKYTDEQLFRYVKAVAERTL